MQKYLSNIVNYFFAANYSNALQPASTIRHPVSGIRILVDIFRYPVYYLLKCSPVILSVFLISSCLKENNSIPYQSFIKFYGHSAYAKGADVKQTNDGGYIIVGTAGTENQGTDIVLIKTDKYGNQEWTPKYFGGNLDDSAYCVQLTNDGGYIIAGSKEMNSNGKVVAKIFIVKTNTQGDTVWTKVIGGTKNDVAYFIQLNGNNGYLVTGYTESYGSGGKDAILINMDPSGNINWLRTYGTRSDEVSKCVQLTKDGYILIGSTNYTVQKSTNILVVKTNNIGLLLQIAIIGGDDNISGENIQTLSNGGYVGIGTKIFAGNSYSSIRLFRLGNEIDSVLWSKDYGNSGEKDEGKSVQITSDNALALIGTKSVSSTNSNFYLIKTDMSGNLIFSRNFGQSGLQNAANIEQTDDEGFILIGTNNIEGYNAITLIKVTSDGSLQ